MGECKKCRSIPCQCPPTESADTPKCPRIRTLQSALTAAEKERDEEQREYESGIAYREKYIVGLQSSLHAAEEKIAALTKQLPEAMQDCTILFKQCPYGHGELTAANWIQHPCSTCERDALRAEVEQLRGERDRLLDDHEALRTRTEKMAQALREIAEDGHERTCELIERVTGEQGKYLDGTPIEGCAGCIATEALKGERA